MLELNDIVRRTRDIINEYVPTGDDFSEESDEMLTSHIAAAARMTAEDVPLHMLHLKTATYGENGSSTSESYKPTPRPDGRRYLKLSLPADYVRMGSLLLQDQDESLNFHEPITQMLPTLHPLYAQQYTQVAGLGAGSHHPRAFANGRTMELHSVEARVSWTGLTVVLSYVPLPQVENGVLGVLSDGLFDLVALRAASLYLGLTGEGNAQAAHEAAEKLLAQMQS